MRNVYPPQKIKKYFLDFGRHIIAVNLIGTDFQARNNGSDQDSDFIYVTNQSDIVDCARKFYKNYSTIINDIPEDETSGGSKKDAAEIDIKLSNAKYEIGMASNLAQLCLTYSYNSPEDKSCELEDYVCILSVLAQIAIDEAKHNFALDIPGVMSDIDQLVRGGRKKFYPEFWEVVLERSAKKYKRNEKEKKDDKKKKKELLDPKKVDKTLICPMNFIYKLDFADGRSSRGSDGLKIEKFFVPQKTEGADSHRTPREVTVLEEAIEEFGLKELISVAFEGGRDDDSQSLLRMDFGEMLKKIRDACPHPSAALCSALIDRAFCITPGQRRNKKTTNRKTDKNKSLMLTVLYALNPKGVLSCFKKEKDMDPEELI